MYQQSFTACYKRVWLVCIPNTHFICTASLLRIPSSPFLKYESDELEKSVYQDYDSDSDVPEELKQDYVDEQTGDAPLKRSAPKSNRFIPLHHFYS